MNCRTLKQVKNKFVTSFVLSFKDYERWKNKKIKFEEVPVYDIWYGNSDQKKFTILDGKAYEKEEVILIPVSIYFEFMISDLLNTKKGNV